MWDRDPSQDFFLRQRQWLLIHRASYHCHLRPLRPPHIGGCGKGRLPLTGLHSGSDQGILGAGELDCVRPGATHHPRPHTPQDLVQTIADWLNQHHQRAQQSMPLSWGGGTSRPSLTCTSPSWRNLMLSGMATPRSSHCPWSSATRAASSMMLEPSPTSTKELSSALSSDLADLACGVISDKLPGFNLASVMPGLVTPPRRFWRKEAETSRFSPSWVRLQDRVLIPSWWFQRLPGWWPSCPRTWRPWVSTPTTSNPEVMADWLMRHLIYSGILRCLVRNLWFFLTSSALASWSPSAQA